MEEGNQYTITFTAHAIRMDDGYHPGVGFDGRNVFVSKETYELKADAINRAEEMGRQSLSQSMTNAMESIKKHLDSLK